MNLTNSVNSHFSKDNFERIARGGVKLDILHQKHVNSLCFKETTRRNRPQGSQTRRLSSNKRQDIICLMNNSSELAAGTSDSTIFIKSLFLVFLVIF